eukprot:CAMPEP_0114241782 /NCGR_PEP_ID=MMETSP0058-20121206/9814_1 /TAXON_ID=36894 /ORGANISM="Pyramimonas parkeae, CCMP726" /LENGTH=232 /DNA_ID=CAMNT_0001354327 /DNA_START=310 /DNA_END=1008 /DNA_ORIENTATION=+
MPQQTQAEKRADATDTISDDILDRIFNHLEPGPKELVAFELVCKKWGAAARRSSAWERAYIRRWPTQPESRWFACEGASATAAPRRLAGQSCLHMLSEDQRVDLLKIAIADYARVIRNLNAAYAAQQDLRTPKDKFKCQVLQERAIRELDGHLNRKAPAPPVESAVHSLDLSRRHHLAGTQVAMQGRMVLRRNRQLMRQMALENRRAMGSFRSDGFLAQRRILVTKSQDMRN